MTNLTIAWISLPFLIGFVIYLLPQFSRWLALLIPIVSAAYAVQIFLLGSFLEVQLLDSFGVTLMVDRLSAWFILTDALVTLSVIFYCWQTGKKSSLGARSLASYADAGSHRFFYMQLVILHGSVNAAFVCADFISLYVALEVISIAAFLLIAYARSDRTIWVGLRYLFVSNTVMLFYLIGAVLVYKANNSFAYQGLLGSPPEAIALIFLGLLAKGGVFVSGLWLPLTHSESATPVSAMLSGIVVKTGVFPMLRCAMLLPEIEPTVRIFGVASALLGVSYAIFQQDSKRTLAFSTVSQLGFVLAAPAVGGFYAFTHGIAKSSLFLIAGNLPSRSFAELRSRGIDLKLRLPLALASLSVCGFPLAAGFGAKVWMGENLLSWQKLIINIATVGTVMTYAKFIFLPRPELASSGNAAKQTTKIQSGLWWAMVILLGGLIIGNAVYPEAYALKNLVKPLVTISIGWLVYLLLLRKLVIKLPRAIEQFEHLIGGMSTILILVFWMVQTQANVLSHF